MRLMFLAPVLLPGLLLVPQETTEGRVTAHSIGGRLRSSAAIVNRKLVSGRYQVVYRTAGHDGHAVRGEYRFTVAK